MILLLLLWLPTLRKNYIKNENHQRHYHQLSHHIHDMGRKFWQVGGGVEERHIDVPSLSNFTTFSFFNMNSYYYSIFFKQ